MSEDGNVLPKFRSRRVPMPSHVDSSQVSGLLNPTIGIREAMQKKGITPRNHQKDNRAIISELSTRNHAMKQAATQPEPPPLKPPKIRIENPPKAQVKAGEVDFLAKNFKDASIAQRKPKTPKAEAADPSLQKGNLGKIPAYLIKRKMELALDAERKLLEEEARNIPAGYVLMPDEEKQEVLKTLEENRKILEKKLQGMPLVVETPSLRRSKTEMDNQLKDIEQAVQRFSRPKVYIALDEE